MDTAFKLQFREHAGAGDGRDDFLIPARFGGVGGHQLHLPADRIGIALIHAEQVAREQGRLVPASPGADFQHGRARIGRIAGQQLQRQRPFGGGQLAFEDLHLLLRHFAHQRVRVRIRAPRHIIERGQFLPQTAHFMRGAGHRLDLGIFLGQAHKRIGRQIGPRHRRLHLIPARLDLRNAFGGDVH